MRRALLVPALLLAGCTFQPGTGFSTLDRVAFEASVAPSAARDLGDDTVLTDLGYRVAISEATLSASSLALQELSGGAAGSFDPAEPPPGYTLCHGGHCHAEDGRVVDYADVEAELAGASASFVDRVSVPLDSSYDLTDGGEAFDLTDAASTLELPLGSVDRAVLQSVALSLRADVFHDDLGDTPLPLQIELEIGTVSAGISLDIDRDSPALLILDSSWGIRGDSFDGIDFAAEASPLLLHDPDLSPTDTLLTHLTAAAFEATLTAPEGY